jgi:hypothetical protein
MYVKANSYVNYAFIINEHDVVQTPNKIKQPLNLCVMGNIVR